MSNTNGNGNGNGNNCVRYTGEDKDKIYEPKRNQKIVRLLTVIAYVFTVSLAGIMLSLYYVFIWHPHMKAAENFTLSIPYNYTRDDRPGEPYALPAQKDLRRDVDTDVPLQIRPPDDVTTSPVGEEEFEEAEESSQVVNDSGGKNASSEVRGKY